MVFRLCRGAQAVYRQRARQYRSGRSPYSYQVTTIRSLGDLRERTSGFVKNFWDIEKPTFTLVHAPAGLSIDPKTGLVTGTPKTGGPVSVSVSLERTAQQVDAKTLSWGNEKVLSTSAVIFGPCVQQYVLNLENQ